MATDNFPVPHSFAVICRDVGYEIGASLKPKSEAELMLAVADIQDLARQMKSSTKNAALNGFVNGVLAALENTHQK